MKATLVAQFEAEMALTGVVLDSVPESRLDWAPHPRSFSLGRLAMHVATIPGWMTALARSDEYDMDKGGPGPAVPADRAALLGAFEAAVRAGRAAIDTCSGEDLERPWTLHRAGVTIATMPRAEAMSRFGLRHLVHHRGQLTVYLRLLDQSVPALYGDSADMRLVPSVGT
jgi:uncharacterized damage-inducible protein DinB